MEFEIALVQSRDIPRELFFEALVRRTEDKVPLGQLALETGLLTARQLREILQLQGDKAERFGAIAVKHGYLDRRDLAELLFLQEERRRPLFEYLIELEAITPEEARAAQVAYKAGARAVAPAQVGLASAAEAEQVEDSDGAKAVTEAALI